MPGSDDGRNGRDQDEVMAAQDGFAPEPEAPASASEPFVAHPGAWSPLPPPPGAPLPPPAGVPSTGGAHPSRPRTALVAIVAFVITIGTGAWLGWGLTSHPGASSSDADRAPITIATPTSPSTGSTSGTFDQAAIARNVTPALVDVNTVLGGIAGSNGQPTGEAAGTGMIVSSSGEVLTNNHVVDGATSIRVTVAGTGPSYSATVIGVDPSADVALLQMQGASGLPTVSFADSSSVTIGEKVVAIGNALGKGGPPAVTHGKITGTDRSITARTDGGEAERLTGLLQMNAPIKPGDSGGPLVNADSQVVGMITAAATLGSAQHGSDIGFAIPVNTAVNVVNQIRGGSSSSDIFLGQVGFLGIQGQDLTPQTAAQLGVSVGSGVQVIAVVPGGPAADAGITRNSVITAIDGRSVTSLSALGPAIHRHKPGDHMQVTWIDGTGSHTATVRLVAGPAI
jgi:S1-C subfamily serine protease